jgi:hypothetical protein
LSELERMFGSLKTEINQLSIPEEMEERLRFALENRALPKPYKGFLQVGLAIAVVALIVISYKWDEISLYGKELAGFDQAAGSVQQPYNTKNLPPKAISAAVVEQEKEKLAQEGYIVKHEGEFDDRVGGYGNFDIAYFLTLKDVVYNSSSVSKGEVLGIKYFVNDNIAYTKAKVLITESYDQQYQAGDIVTVVKRGGIITHYEQIIKDEIDKKFNIPQAELEEAKKKMVIADNHDGNLLFPSDQILIFLGEMTKFDQAGVESYIMSGPVIKFNGDVIRNKVENAWESPYVLEEFYGGSLSDLEGRIRKDLEAKQNFSKEKARKAAYQALTDSQRQEVLDLETAVVLYHEKGIYHVEGLGVKTPEATITVIFKTSKGGFTVYLVDDNYRVLKVFPHTN